MFRIWLRTMPILILLLVSRGAWAKPVEVIFFPDSAHVTEVSEVPVRMEGRGEGRTVLILPSHTKPESLQIFPEKDSALRISNISWRRIPSRQLDSKGTHQKQLQKLTEERNQLQATIKGLEAQIAFWQSQTKAKAKKLNDAFNLSAAISRNTKKAWQEKINLEGQCEKLEQRIAILQLESKNDNKKASEDWEVTLSLTVLKPELRSVSLRYSYTLFDCGWAPLYRLEAKQRHQHIEFSWEAEVWQNTTQDWKNVELSLADEMTPNLPVAGKQPEWRVTAQKTGNRPVTGKKEKADAVKAPIRNPVAPFLRLLGSRNVPAGRKKILPVENAIWPATFTYVLRPFSGYASQIMAEVNLTSPVDIPENKALFFREGILQGRQSFSFAGKKKTLFFGSDPDVSGEVKLLSDQEDMPAIDGRKQVWDWHWQVVLKNESHQLIKLRVEEPVPKSGSSRIKCNVRGEPVFQEGQLLLGIRELELPSGGGRTLETFVGIEAPQDMKVDMSWNP